MRHFENHLDVAFPKPSEEERKLNSLSSEFYEDFFNEKIEYIWNKQGKFENPKDNDFPTRPESVDCTDLRKELQGNHVDNSTKVIHRPFNHNGTEFSDCQISKFTHDEEEFPDHPANELKSIEVEVPDYPISEFKSINEISGWIKDINPKFDPWDYDSPYCNNCGSCAYAVFQRLNGDKSAYATAENIAYNSEMNSLTGMTQEKRSLEYIKNSLLKAGNGAHTIIGLDRAEGAGHWFNAACLDGKIIVIDGQDGSIKEWPPDYEDVIRWEVGIMKGEHDHG